MLKNIHIRKSLFLKMVVSSILVVVIAIALLVSYTYATNVRVLKTHAIDGNLKDLHLISEKIDAYLNMLELVSAFTYEKDLQTLLTRTGNESSITSMRRLRNFQDFYYKRLVSLNYEGQIKDIYFIYPDGEVLHRGDGIYRTDYDFTRQDWYQRAVDTAGRTVVVDTHAQTYNLPKKYPEVDDGSSGHCISVARRVNSYGRNTLMGVLMMDIDVTELTKMLGPLLLSDQSQVYFSGASGKILYSVNTDEIGATLPRELVQSFEKQEEGSRSGQIAGQESVTTWMRSDKTGWYLVNINPTSLILADIATMKRNILLMAAAAFVLTAAVSLTYARRIFRPVGTLAKAMKQVEQGRMDIEVTVASDDEIGYLSAAFNHMLARIRRLINENYVSRLKEKDAQIESLQLQINPHFLYNTLESMNCIALVREVDEISVISKALASMFRYSIRYSGATVPVSDELNHIRNYMNIQKIRFGNRVAVTYEMVPEVMDCLMIPLILQPLVENAIKYSVEEAGMIVHICISIKKQADGLHFCVTDDGTGIEQNRLEQLRAELRQADNEGRKSKRGHIGLINVHSRLRLRYGESCGLEIDSEKDNFTCVSFVIPYEKSAPDCQFPPH